jgi:DNA polymerase-3 subunit epsilon
MQSTLPEKYYLSHAQELFSFVANQCDGLLADNHRKYIERYKQLNEEAQCLLIRFLSRKPRFFNRVSIDYPEISDIDKALGDLVESGFMSPVHDSDWSDFLTVLTKAQLLSCLRTSQVKALSSTAKSELLLIAQECCKAEANINLRYLFVVRRQQSTIDYILFLFFGDLRNRLQKFAMRDLGVLKTRKSKALAAARFTSQKEAQSAFKLQCLQRDFAQQPQALKESAARYLLDTSPTGPIAQEISDRLLLRVGTEFSGDNSDMAIKLWQASNEPQAAERWIREWYRYGDRGELEITLRQLRHLELPAITKVFVEDFYARKYQGKRTSIYTDMLRETSYKLHIDEVYLNQVEEGAIQHYRRNGSLAYFTENHHWRMLFALTFWQLLFRNEKQFGSQFDSLPLSLSTGTFYQDNLDQIDACLKILDTPDLAIEKFTQLATRHYGYPTGLFRWSANLLGSIQPCLELSPPGSLATVLRRMAKNFRHTKDGYPDLMVVKDGQLRFEEIKAPGDVLRPNQLVSINRLRQAGLAVELTQVEWATDPKQKYAVVDIETTGGRKSGNSITEIAVVTVRNHRVVRQWSSLVNPQRRIPAYITQLTGIDNGMVANAPLFSEIADELEAQLKDCIFVAHNVGFDYGFIKSAFESINRSFQKPKYCTVRHARKSFPGLKSYSLGNLTEHFDISLNNHHRALSDAKATAELLLLIQNQTQNFS